MNQIHILFLEDKIILVSSGNERTKFWNLIKDNYNYMNCIKYFEDTFCGSNKALCRLYVDLMKIILLLEEKKWNNENNFNI